MSLGHLMAQNSIGLPCGTFQFNIMNRFKIWVTAARLRTLPLSLSGIIVGNALALNAPEFSLTLFLFSLLSAICFQIISNFANDYGDGVKGTDNEARVGPKRVLQQGLLTPESLKKGIIILSLISLIIALTLILLAFGFSEAFSVLIFIMMAVAAVAAAIKYTVGGNAYGYRGLGDLFVFIFFGGVSVLGSYFLQLKTLTTQSLLFAVAIGLLSVAVLNLNNMRDRENDLAVGKNTLVVLMGAKAAKFYHAFLILFSLLLLGFAIESHQLISIRSLPFLAFIPLMIHFFKVMFQKVPEKLDPELKRLALSVFLLSLLVFITQYFL